MGSGDSQSGSGTDEQWFEVDSVTDVVDRTGAPIGRLQPGWPYRASDITAFQVVVPGPEGCEGYVSRSAVRLVAGPPDTASSAASAPDEAENRPATPASSQSATPQPKARTEAPETTDGPGRRWTRWAVAAVVLAVVAGAAAWVTSSREDSAGTTTTVDDTDQSLTDAAAIWIIAGSDDAGGSTASVDNADQTGADDVAVDGTASPEDEPAIVGAADTTVAAQAAETGPLLESRAPGPYVAPTNGTAVTFGPPDLGPSLSADVCPSGSVSLYVFDVADRDGTVVRASGYGVVDPEGQGRLSVWYENEAGHLIGFDEPGDPYVVTVTANTATIRGARFDLDLVYLWTRPPSDAEPLCELIDDLVENLGV